MMRVEDIEGAIMELNIIAVIRDGRVHFKLKGKSKVEQKHLSSDTRWIDQLRDWVEDGIYKKFGSSNPRWYR